MVWRAQKDQMTQTLQPRMARVGSSMTVAVGDQPQTPHRPL